MSNSTKKNIRILSVKAGEYSSIDEYKRQALEQYKLYINVTDNHSARVMAVFKFFLALNLAFISGFILFTKQNVRIEYYEIVILGLFAFIICFLWWAMIKSTIKVNKARYGTIQVMEKYLPFRPYSYDWQEKLNKDKRYIGLAQIFSIVPVLFVFLYLGLITFSIYTNYHKSNKIKSKTEEVNKIH